MNEQDLRLALLNTLLTTPHRDLAALCPIHRDMIECDMIECDMIECDMIECDPRFYVRLAA